MNKRTKKKYRITELELKVQQLDSFVYYCLSELNRQDKEITNLENLVTTNAQASNREFDSIRKQVNQKKSWFGRK